MSDQAKDAKNDLTNHRTNAEPCAKPGQVSKWNDDWGLEVSVWWYDTRKKEDNEMKAFNLDRSFQFFKITEFGRRQTLYNFRYEAQKNTRETWGMPCNVSS